MSHQVTMWMLQSANRDRDNRISQDNLVSLRKTTSRSIRRIKSPIESLTAFVSGVFNEVALLATPKRDHNMCKYYGHVITSGNWSGYLPKCTDCGTEIHTADQLRRSDPRMAHAPISI